MKTVTKLVVRVTLSHVYTKAEAESPAGSKSICGGTTTAIGKREDSCSVSKVTTARRLGESESHRRLAGSTIELDIVSETDDTTALKANINAAAADGSIGANIKAEAADNGALTAALKASSDIVTVALTDTTKTVIEYTFKPTQPTAAKAAKKKKGLSVGAQVGLAIGCAAALAGIGFLLFKMMSTPAAASQPAKAGEVQQALEY